MNGLDARCNTVLHYRYKESTQPKGKTMKLVTINGNGNNDHDVAVHRADCRDVKKDIRGHDWFDDDFETKRELWLDYNADFLEEGSGAWPIHFHACTQGLPDGGEYNL